VGKNIGKNKINNGGEITVVWKGVTTCKTTKVTSRTIHDLYFPCTVDGTLPSNKYAHRLKYKDVLGFLMPSFSFMVFFLFYYGRMSITVGVEVHQEKSI